MIKRLRFSIEKYMDIVEAGVFEKDNVHVELIRGEILEMNPIGPEHCELVRRLNDWSHQETDHGRWAIWVQQPIALHDSDSVPEPDLAWVANRSYSDRYPRGDEIALVIEVCYSSQTYDRGTKSEIYASAGIQEYWIVDAVSSTPQIRRKPIGNTYSEIADCGVNAQLSPLCQPDAILALNQLFPST
jgi:Uma2 family endonuclease